MVADDDVALTVAQGVITSAIDGCIGTLHEILARKAETGAVIDLSGMFFRLTFESFVKMSYVAPRLMPNGRRRNDAEPTLADSAEAPGR